MNTTTRHHPLQSILLLLILFAGLNHLVGMFVNRRVGKTRMDTITVDGKARRVVKSDFAIWTATISSYAPTVPQAYAEIKDSSTKVQAYFKKKGVPSADVLPQAINSQILYAPQKPVPAGYTQPTDDTYRPVVGYHLTQDIEIRSSQVDQVDKISRSATELISLGVPLQSAAPMFLVSNLAEVKDSIIAEAAKNAYVRAEEIAQSSNASISGLHYSHMGLVSVTDAYGVQSGDDGGEDTSSVEKMITVEVSSAFDVR